MMFTKSECKPTRKSKNFSPYYLAFNAHRFFGYYNEIYVSANKRLNPSGIKIAQRRTDSVYLN